VKKFVEFRSNKCSREMMTPQGRDWLESYEALLMPPDAPRPARYLCATLV
jgi:hypothetical protein